jgi:hypothetical protein
MCLLVIGGLIGLRNGLVTRSRLFPVDAREYQPRGPEFATVDLSDLRSSRRRS